MQKMSTLHQQPHIPWFPLHRGNSNIARYDLGVKPPHCINQRGFKGHFFGGLVMRMLWEFVSSMWALNPGLRFLRYIHSNVYIYIYIWNRAIIPLNRWLFNLTCPVPPPPGKWLAPSSLQCGPRRSSAHRRPWEDVAPGKLPRRETFNCHDMNRTPDRSKNEYSKS